MSASVSQVVGVDHGRSGGLGWIRSFAPGENTPLNDMTARARLDIDCVGVDIIIASVLKSVIKCDGWGNGNHHIYSFRKTRKSKC